MLHLIPQPKKITEESQILTKKSLTLISDIPDERLKKAVAKLPLATDGIPFILTYDNTQEEAYILTVSKEQITLHGKSAAAAFWGIQTLRQLFQNETIPCLTIEDCPDFPYRGFYQDATRGKVPKVETVKQLIDEMAYYKMNSLQLYVEHTFEFREYADSIERTGYFTAEEIRELDDYCYENFIEFIPSLSCFGHLQELLEKPQYKHLCEIENYKREQIHWFDRMNHHTIDPTNPESFELIKSLIDQYMPLFRSDKFNICCDETFDLHIGKHWNQDIGRLYIDFVKKLVNHVQQKGKKVMMWADILLKYPEVINELPDNIQFLNWWYEPDVKEADIKLFDTLKKPQIVCPGTSAWDGLTEYALKAEKNISVMAEFGYRYGADGMLNTNWGDYGTPSSIDLSLYSMVVGAEKSWSANTDIDDTYRAHANYLLYQNENGFYYITKLREYQNMVPYNELVKCYNNTLHEKHLAFHLGMPTRETILTVQKGCQEIISRLEKETWVRDEFRKEMLLAAEGIIVIAELFSKVTCQTVERITNTKAWLEKHAESWLRKNKTGELSEVQKIYLTLEESY